MRAQQVFETLVEKGRNAELQRLRTEAWQERQAALERRSQACLERYEAEVLGPFDRIMKLALESPQKAENAQCEVAEPAIARAGLFRMGKRRHGVQQTPQVQPAEPRRSQQALRVVLGEGTVIEGFGNGVPVADVWLWDGYRGERVGYEHRADYNPAFRVVYKFERPGTQSSLLETEHFSYDPKIGGQTSRRMRYLTENYCDSESIKQREDFVQAQVEKATGTLCELVRFACDPDLNPELAKRLADQALMIEG